MREAHRRSSGNKIALLERCSDSLRTEASARPSATLDASSKGANKILAAIDPIANSRSCQDTKPDQSFFPEYWNLCNLTKI